MADGTHYRFVFVYLLISIPTIFSHFLKTSRKITFLNNADGHEKNKIKYGFNEKQKCFIIFHTQGYRKDF